MSNSNSSHLRVDVESVLAGKSRRLARLTPSFLKSYLKHIVHQDEINDILSRFSHLHGIDFIRACFGALDISYSPHGLDRLSVSGRYLFASNHPFGGIDGMMLLDELHGYFGSGKIIVNDILMNISPLGELFLPVNKHGSQNRRYLKQIDDAMLSDTPIATFPAGLCSRRVSGEVTDLPWKSNFVKKAVDSHRDIVPVYFDGRLSEFFYRLYTIRKTLGIGANIEMLYLVDELFKQRGSHFDIYYGEPLKVDTVKRPDYNAIANKVREEVYRMRPQK